MDTLKSLHDNYWLNRTIKNMIIYAYMHFPFWHCKPLFFPHWHEEWRHDVELSAITGHNSFKIILIIFKFRKEWYKSYDMFLNHYSKMMFSYHTLNQNRIVFWYLKYLINNNTSIFHSSMLSHYLSHTDMLRMDKANSGGHLMDTFLLWNINYNKKLLNSL